MRKFTEDERKLFRAIVSITEEEECANFFEDICTIKEIKDLSQRLCVAKMLKKGDRYQDIEAATGASTATISRVNKCLVYGSGGYLSVLEKMDEDK